MKKTLLFTAAVLVLAACAKESPVKEESAIDASKLVFNIDVRNADATKGVKTAWEAGDDVYVFFEDNATQYVKMTYDGSAWTYTDKDGNTTFSGLTLTASGKKLSAVYMPDFVCSVAPTYDSGNARWTFGSVGGYYQKTVDEGVAYTVTSTDDVTTLNAIINLTAPANIMQFFVPSDQCAAPGTGNEYVLTATHVINYSFNGIVPGGAASKGINLEGGAMQGYSGTLGGEAGYYFWGILKAAGTYTFDCQLVKQNAEKKYAISSYSAIRDDISESISSAAIKLTGLTDRGNFVSLGYDGGPLWATGNLDKTNSTIVGPLEAGEYFMYGYTTPYNSSDAAYTGTEAPLSTDHDAAYQANYTWRIPTRAQFNALISSDNTTTERKTGWTNLGNTKGGFLITSKKNGISLFFAAAGDYDRGSLYGAGSYGGYWSSTHSGSHFAYCLFFFGGDIYTDSFDRGYGFPVRPVQN